MTEVLASRPDALAAVRTIPHHALPAADVLDAAASSVDGLQGHEAARRLAADGPNRITSGRRRTWVESLLAQFNDVLIYVLLGAAVVTIALRHVTDTAVILGVVVINALIGLFQERRAERSLNAIRELLAEQAVVVRDGRRLQLPVEDVVTGDIVVLDAGDKVPADLRLISTHTLQIEEAILTGESAAADKSIAPVEADAPLGDRTSMAFAGTIVVRGNAHGVVVATGDNTELGHINAMLGHVKPPETPLTRQLAALGRTVSMLILALTAASFAIGHFVYGWDLAELFLAAVAIAVAAIPEGLPAIVTITLAIGVERMARRRAIVRVLPAVETLGSVGVICSDKTGTFTFNEMMVERAVTADATYTVGGRGYEPEGTITQGGETVAPALHADLTRLAEAAAHCNDATLARTDGDWRVRGDPLEGALLAFAAKAGVEIDGDAKPPRRAEIPFDSSERFMATVAEHADSAHVVYVKGAPERIIAMCDRERANGADAPIDAAAWERRLVAMASRGLRVIALAEKALGNGLASLSVADVDTGLTMIGLVGLIDPPRPEAISAVADCRTAGIRVKMITGDHAGNRLGHRRAAGSCRARQRAHRQRHRPHERRRTWRRDRRGRRVRPHQSRAQAPPRALARGPRRGGRHDRRRRQ